MAEALEDATVTTATPQKPRTLRGASRTDTTRPRRRPLSPTSRRPRLRRSAPVRQSTSRRTTRSPRTALTCTPTPSRGGTARSRRTRPSRATRRTSTTRSPRRSRPTTSLTPTAVGASSSSTGSASDALTSYPSLASSWARPASSALSRPRAPCGCLPPTATTSTSVDKKEKPRVPALDVRLLTALQVLQEIPYAPFSFLQRRSGRASLRRLLRSTIEPPAKCQHPQNRNRRGSGQTSKNGRESARGTENSCGIPAIFTGTA